MVSEVWNIMTQTEFNMVENKEMVKTLNIKVVKKQNVINRSCQEWSQKFEISYYDTDWVQHGWEQGHGQDLEHQSCQKAKCH